MIWHGTLLCYVVLGCATLRHAALCYVMSLMNVRCCYAFLCYVILCVVMLCYALGMDNYALIWYDMA